MSEKEVAGSEQTSGGGGGGEATPQPQGDQKPWYSTYPQDFHESLKGYDKPETLIKEHVELKKKTSVPGDYTFDTKGLDDTQVKAVDTFKAEAKELGLSQPMFEKMVTKALAQNKEFWERRKAEDAEAKSKKDAEIKKSVEELRNEWGNKFESNLERAKKTAQSLFPPTFGKFLDDTGIGNHPEMIRAMVRLADSVSEDALVINQKKQRPGNRDPQTGEPMLKFKGM